MFFFIILLVFNLFLFFLYFCFIYYYLLIDFLYLLICLIYIIVFNFFVEFDEFVFLFIKLYGLDLYRFGGGMKVVLEEWLGCGGGRGVKGVLVGMR